MEEAALAEALEKGAKRMGFRQKETVVPQNDSSALRQLLEAMNIKDYELEEDDLKTPEEQLVGITCHGLVLTTREAQLSTHLRVHTDIKLCHMDMLYDGCR